MKKNVYRRVLAIATLSVFVAIGLMGCQSILGKRNNGSLAYQSVEKLPPLQLPASQVTADFIPIYPIPTLGQNTLQIANDAGTQYQLPKPPKTVQ